MLFEKAIRRFSPEDKIFYFINCNFSLVYNFTQKNVFIQYNHENKHGVIPKRGIKRLRTTLKKYIFENIFYQVLLCDRYALQTTTIKKSYICVCLLAKI